MLIECTVTRDAPIVVPIGNEKYEFKPDEKGRKVAEVWIESHVQSFLACSHLYREVKDGEPDAAEPVILGTMKRPELQAALRERGIEFGATETNAALREKLAVALKAEAAEQP